MGLVGRGGEWGEGGLNRGVWGLRCHEVKIRSTRAQTLVPREWVMLTAATICLLESLPLRIWRRRKRRVELSCFGFAQAALRKTGRDMDLVKSYLSLSVMRSAPTGQFPWHAWLRIANTPMDLEPGSLYPGTQEAVYYR